MNTVTLTHPFKDKIPDLDEFFGRSCAGITGLSQFCKVDTMCRQIVKLSEKYHPESSEDADKFKGDAFELFVEYMMLQNGMDNRIGVVDYVPTRNDAVGVDGTGKGMNGDPATVQCKFCANPLFLLTDKHGELSRFSNSSSKQYGVKGRPNMLLVTTGSGINAITMALILYNEVRVLNRSDLIQMFDGPEMLVFWQGFYESVKASQTKILVVKPDPIVLRDFQRDAVDSALSDLTKRGRILLPTGTGKTLVEAEIAAQTIRDQKALGNLSPVIKVNSPRILLCVQLFEDVYNYLLSQGLNALYVNFNTGETDDAKYAATIRQMGGVFSSLVSTTNPEEVKEAYAKAQEKGLPLVVFSTYHSSEEFARSEIPVCLTLHDEAHNLVSNNWTNVASLPSGASYFLTATQKKTPSDKGLGMNNKDLFGEILYSRTPKQMIEKGEMVPPRIHIVGVKKGSVEIDLGKLDMDYEALALSVFDAFVEHKKKIKESSRSPDEMGAKVLVVCRGQNELNELMEPEDEDDSILFKNKVFDILHRAHPELHLFALSSDYGIYNDGVYVDPPVNNGKKDELLKRIKSMKPNDDALIFHVDMIGEGIDVPGITGVMPFRNCSDTKFVQNIGRASRLRKEDRARVYSGEILPNDQDRAIDKKWIKPYSWIIIPSFLENSRDFSVKFKRIIKRLRSDFGWIPSQDVDMDNVRAWLDKTPTETVNDITPGTSRSRSKVTEFTHEFEALTVIDKTMMEEAEEEIQAAAQRKKEEEFLRRLDEGILDPVSEDSSPVGIEKESGDRGNGKHFKARGGDLKDSPEFTLKYNGSVAKGMIKGGKFVVLVGSQIRQKVNASCPKEVIQDRENSVKDGSVVDGVVQVELSFGSPSRAASFVVGGSMNGNDTWKNDEGTFGGWLGGIEQK